MCYLATVEDGGTDEFRESRNMFALRVIKGGRGTSVSTHSPDPPMDEVRAVFCEILRGCPLIRRLLRRRW